MRMGTWTAFKAKNPDYLRQSISSMRELLNHVLHTLSPNCKTRKERIRDILSKNGVGSAEADFIESLAEYVDKLYALLSKVEHTLYKNDECVEMALKATEAAIVVILG